MVIYYLVKFKETETIITLFLGISQEGLILSGYYSGVSALQAGHRQPFAEFLGNLTGETHLNQWGYHCCGAFQKHENSSTPGDSRWRFLRISSVRQNYHRRR